MSRMWNVSGLLVEPSNRSGVHVGPNARCTCDPTVGDSCERCDGEADEAYLASRASLPERVAALRDLAVWRGRRQDRATRTHTPGDAA